MNKYYVYFHKNPKTNEIFYVGKGCGNRAYVSQNRGKHYKNYIKKHGEPHIEIIKDNLSNEEACSLEKKLIEKYGRKELKLGKLVNSTDGGDKGVVGMIHSDESKIKMGESKKGKTSPYKGKKWTDETREKYIKSVLGSKRGPYKERKDKGKTFSDEIKKRMSDGKLGKKVILQFDENDTFIKEWPTTVMAERDLGINGIRNALDTLNPVRKCGGFIWKRKK
jgi:hypothetical protein